MNEQELIAKARAAQLERERQATEHKNKIAQLAQHEQITWAYILQWASRFPALARQVGLPYYDMHSWTLYQNQLYVDCDGRLLRGIGQDEELADSRCISLVVHPRFSEAEMRQRVDEFFENALMGNPKYVTGD